LFLTEEAARPAEYSLSNGGTLEDLYGAIQGLSTPYTPDCVSRYSPKTSLQMSQISCTVAYSFTASIT